MLTVKLHDSLIPFDHATWKKFFKGHPDPPELIELMDKCRISGSALGSIVVKRNDDVILFLPTFLAPYDLTTTLSGKTSRVATFVKRFAPDLLHPTVLGVGFVEGEWGHVGYDSTATLAELQQAWQLALKTLKLLERKTKPDIVCFKDFTHTSGYALPMPYLRNYMFVASLPICQMNLPFKTLDQYFTSIEADMARYLKRIWKRRKEIDVVRTIDPAPFIDAIYNLYEEQVRRSDTSFGVHPKSFFSQVCRQVPGAQYVLYFASDRLIGFELLVVSNDSLVQKYIGIDQTHGRQYKLFFLSWLENIQYCLDRKIAHTHVGATQEALKVRLGGELIPSAVLFRHLNPVINTFLTLVQSEVAYASQVKVPLPALGGLWQSNKQAAKAAHAQSANALSGTSLASTAK